MADNAADRHASVRAITGTNGDYAGDWHALFNLQGIPDGEFSGRMIAWINAKLGTSYTGINAAMYAFAASKGAASWGEMGIFALYRRLLKADGTSFLLLANGLSRLALAT